FRSGAIFLAHDIPPAAGASTLLGLAPLHQLMEKQFGLLERQAPHRIQCFGFRSRSHDELRLQMPFDTLGTHATPLEKEQVTTPWRARVACDICSCLNAVGESIRTLQRSRTLVHCSISPHRPFITAIVVRREKPAHDSCRVRRLPRTSPSTVLTGSEARYAGRAASRRMGYAYHCLPNGTYTRRFLLPRTRCS